MQQHIHSDAELTADQAAEFLGIDLKNLAAILERYGVGRHYEARSGDEFVYDRADLEKIKRDLEKAGDGGSS
jgi:hypothetical protein